MRETTTVNCRSTLLIMRRSNKPFATSPDAAWTRRLASEPAQQEEEDEKEEPSTKRARKNDGEAEEDEDSEPSDGEDD